MIIKGDKTFKEYKDFLDVLQKKLKDIESGYTMHNSMTGSFVDTEPDNSACYSDTLVFCKKGINSLDDKKKKKSSDNDKDDKNSYFNCESADNKQLELVEIKLKENIDNDIIDHNIFLDYLSSKQKNLHEEVQVSSKLKQKKATGKNPKSGNKKPSHSCTFKFSSSPRNFLKSEISLSKRMLKIDEKKLTEKVENLLRKIPTGNSNEDSAV